MGRGTFLGFVIEWDGGFEMGIGWLICEGKAVRSVEERGWGYKCCGEGRVGIIILCRMMVLCAKEWDCKRMGLKRRKNGRLFHCLGGCFCVREWDGTRVTKKKEWV